MLSLKLCKTLEEASFARRDDYKGDFLEGEVCDICNEHFYYCPTLEELIEACGEEFQLTKWDSSSFQKWVASQETYYDDAGYQGVIGEGETPEMAVANLWLALHKK